MLHNLGCTTGQLALAWLLAQGDNIVPIPGTKSTKYLEENVAAAHIVLTAEEEQEIRAEIQKAAVLGHRLPPGIPYEDYGDSPEL